MSHSHQRTFATLGLALLAPLGMTATAAASPVLFDVDFNDVTIPEPPGYVAVPTEAPTAGQTATLPTDKLDQSPGSIRVTPSFVDSVTGATLGGNGDQVAIIDDPDDEPFYLGFEVAQADRPTSGKVEITFDFIADSFADDEGQPANNELSFVVLGSGGLGDNLANYKLRQQNGRITATQYNADGSTDGGTLGGNGTFALGEVTPVRIVVDLDADRSSIYLDGQLVASGSLTDGTYSLNIKPEQGFGGFSVNSPSVYTSRVGIDNVLVTIPEPATLGLGSLGAVLMLSRRR